MFSNARKLKKLKADRRGTFFFRDREGGGLGETKEAGPRSLSREHTHTHTHTHSRNSPERDGKARHTRRVRKSNISIDKGRVELFIDRGNDRLFSPSFLLFFFSLPTRGKQQPCDHRPTSASDIYEKAKTLTPRPTTLDI